MMKNKDLQTLEMLKGEFGKSVETAKVPLKLQKQSIVHMLEKDAQQRKAQEEAESKKKYQVVTVKKLMAIAAALVVTVSGTLMMQTGGPGASLLNASSKSSDEAIDSFGDYNEVLVKGPIVLEHVNVVPSNPQNENPFNSQEPVIPEITLPEIQPGIDNPINNQQPSEPVVTTPVQEIPEEKEEIKYEYIYQETPSTDLGVTPVEDELITNSSEGVSKNEEYEADIVKAYGDYMYILTTGTDSETNENEEIIRIAKIVPGDDLRDISKITVTAEYNKNRINECVEINIHENKLITISNSKEYSVWDEVYSESIETIVVYYDISDPANPQKIHTHIQDGEYVSSKWCEDKLYIVTLTNIPEVDENTDPESIIPGYRINNEEGKTLVAPENIFVDKNSSATRTFTYVTVTDMSEISAPVQFAFYGGGKDVYCYADTVVLSRLTAKTNEDTGAADYYTFIYRFNIDGDKVSCADYVSMLNGVIVGGIHVNEKDGAVRTVTRSSKCYNVYAMNEQMEWDGYVEDILIGVTVEKVKYFGNKLYLVHGENTSIIDFSKKLSEENITTVPTAISTNLYEVTSSVLLGIGFAGEEKKPVFTLFDFSDPENFRNTDEYTLPEGFTLAAGNNGRCIMVDSENKIFGVPVIRTDAETNNDVSSYLIFSVEDGVITLVGECIHDDAVVGDAASRCVCVNNTIYTISGGRIVSHSVSDYAEISMLEFID